MPVATTTTTMLTAWMLRKEDGRKLSMSTEFPRKEERPKDVADTSASQNKCSDCDNLISTYLLLTNSLLLFVQVIIISYNDIVTIAKLILLLTNTIQLLLNTMQQ